MTWPSCERHSKIQLLEPFHMHKANRGAFVLTWRMSCDKVRSTETATLDLFSSIRENTCWASLFSDTSALSLKDISWIWTCRRHSRQYYRTKVGTRSFMLETTFCTCICVYNSWLLKKWALSWENLLIPLWTTKTQISLCIRAVCAFAQSDQRLCCLLPGEYNTPRFYILNFKH